MRLRHEAEGGSVTVAIRHRPFGLVVSGAQRRDVVTVDQVEVDLGGKRGHSGAQAAEGWRLRLRARDDEAFYGFGERFNAVNQRGNPVQIWGADAGLGSYLGVRMTAYKNTPWYLSTSGYALFWDSSYRLDCDMGATKPDEVSIVADGPILDIHLFAQDDPKASLTALAELTGKPLLPPRWAFGPWMGREAGAWRNTGHVKGDAIGEMLYVVDRFQQLDIPHTALYAEGLSAGHPRLYRSLQGKGIRVLAWQAPTPHVFWRGLHDSVPAIESYQDLLLKNKDGSVFHVPRGCFRQGEPYTDFTHPKALEYWRKVFAGPLKLGLAGTMVDDGDDVGVDTVFHNGRTGRRMHNRFHYHYHRVFNQVFREARGDDFILFARAAGPGSQRFVCFFAGDHPESFDGLESVIHGGISFGASGFPFWGSDIGGLLPRPFEPLIEPVYNRWVAFAALSPLMRAHGCSPREPWRFGQRSIATYKHYAWLRMNLLPTIYSLAVEAHRTGVPLMRVGYLEFPDDPELLEIDLAYAFGSDLWVVPVTHAEATQRVYLPAGGTWTDIYTGETIEGGQGMRRPAGYGREPLLLREGGVLLADLEARSLRWGRSMTPGKRRCLVCSTANDSVSKRRLFADRELEIRVASGRKGRLWALAADCTGSPVSGLVLYGTRPTAVRWQGRQASRLEAAPGSTEVASGACWWYDDEQRAVKVVAPASTQLRVEVVFE